jgi:formylglycine-generating enzyme required for sulfatase activity
MMSGHASLKRKWLWAWSLGAAIGCGSRAAGDAGHAPDGATLDAADTAPEASADAAPEVAALDDTVSLAVPAQSFTLGGNVETPTSAATVSAFSLDELEVTVRRFQRFVDAYDGWRVAGNPTAGAGAHPLIPGSGWQPDWSASLPSTASDLVGDGAGGVQCGASQTWGLGDPELPINCVSWYEAFALCIWEGKRLPTEAEWEDAATGGSEQRPFPWGATPPDASLAVYDCVADGSAPGDCASSDILAVGSRPAGAGRWGHRDLAGSVWEWVLDWYAAYPPFSNDSANLTAGTYRVIRGSGWYSSADDLRVAIRYSVAPSAQRGEFGFRCAR